MRITLVILAAGRASRYGRLKQLEPVGPHGAAIMDYGIHDAVRAGVDRVVLIVPPGEETRFEDHVRGHAGAALDLTCVPQSLEPLPPGFSVPAGRTKPWGTAHAVLAAESALDGPFLVANADDHYGRASYALLTAWLRGVPAGGAQFAIVGYRLADTLSPHGGVSRAICRVDQDGWLLEIEEVLDVARLAGGTTGRAVDGTPRSLRGDELVSQNLWGFTPAVLPLLHAQFATFLQERGNDAGAEFLIPTAAMQHLQAGTASYRVLPTRSDWFGLTFPEDTEGVRARIAESHARGDYPDHLVQGIT